MPSNIPMKDECSCSLCEAKENNNIAIKIMFIILLCLLFSVVTAVCFVHLAHAYTQDQAIQATIGEAEDQGLIGMEAVACAIRNRGSLRGVYGFKAPRVIKHKYRLETLKMAKYAILQSQDKDFCESLVHGATFWEGTRFKRPYWASGMIVTATIKDQRFYKKG